MLSIRKFMERFTDEQSCREFLYHIRWPRGFICTKCGESKACLIKTRNVYECGHCRTQTSLTANTLMHRTKLPLRCWLISIYWVASGRRCSARKLANALHLNYRTARRLLNNVRLAMYKEENAFMFDFWNRDVRSSQPPIVRRALLGMCRKARAFIRRYYGRVAERNRLYYFWEYRFRSNNSHNPDGTLIKLITRLCGTIYTLTEYGEDRYSSRKATSMPV